MYIYIYIYVHMYTRNYIYKYMLPPGRTYLDKNPRKRKQHHREKGSRELLVRDLVQIC